MLAALDTPGPFTMQPECHFLDAFILLFPYKDRLEANLLLAVVDLRDHDLFLGHKVDFTADEGCAIVPQSLGGRRVLI